MVDTLVFGFYVAVGLALLGLGLAPGAYLLGNRFGLRQSRNFWRVAVVALCALQGIVSLALPVLVRLGDWLVNTQAHAVAADFILAQIKSQGVGMVVGGVAAVAVVMVAGYRLERLNRTRPERFDPDDVVQGR